MFYVRKKNAGPNHRRKPFWTMAKSEVKNSNLN